MLRFPSHRAWLFGALLAACGEPLPRSATRPPAELAEEPRLSAEWIRVAESGADGRDQVCQQAFAYIVGEAQCASTACRHALRLARDWTAHCRAVASGSRAAEVERLSILYESRAIKPPDACVEQAERWLRDGCGQNGACQDQAHDWTTRCAKATGSPLLLMLLEKTIEQSLNGARSARLAGQSCNDLGAGLRQAAECDVRSACKDALPKLDLYRQRCRTGKLTPIGPAEGLAELAILQGAGQSPPPLAVSSEPRELGPEQSRVVLVGGSGAVLRVCGKRVIDLDQYLDQRRQCTNGEVLVAQVFSDQGERALRLGTFDHPGDAVFARRLPSLTVVGEPEQRHQTQLASLTTLLDSIVQRKTEQEGLCALGRALVEFGPALRLSEAVSKLLEDRDAALQSMFADLGRRKRRTNLASLSAPARYAFGARARALPLGDLDAEGVVAVGATSPVAGLELDQALPKSLAAYRAELGALGKTRLEPQGEQALAGEIGAHTEDCKTALEAAGQLEQALVDCAYDAAACAPERRQTLARELDEARARAEKARILTALSLAYLPKATRESARQDAFAEGACAR